MMRRQSLAPALAACVLALVAVPAAAQKAAGVSDSFIGSVAAEPRFVSMGSQQFAFKPFTVSCAQAKSTKSGLTPEWPAQSLFAEVVFSGCMANAELHGIGDLELKARFLTPVELNFNANGFVEAGAGGKPVDGKLGGAGAIEIALTGAIKCTIDVEAGTFPAKALKEPGEEYEAATYKPEEVELGTKPNVEDKLAITTNLSKMNYALEGEFCEALSKTEGKSGAYDGGLLAELPKSSLDWATPAAHSSDFATPTESSPYDIVAGPDGNLWFTEDSPSKIGEINPVTHATSDYPTPTPESFPAEIATGPDGNLWFTEFEASKIGEINPVTHATSDYPTTTPESWPYYLTVGPEGNIWFTELKASKIGEINSVTHATSDYSTPSAGSYPWGITTGPEGNIWFGEPGANKIGEINPVTHATSDFSLATTYSEAVGVVAGPEGNLWFTDPYKNRIGEFNPLTHATSEYPIPARESEPEHLAVGPEGNIWFTEREADRIAEINPITHATADFPTPTAVSYPLGIGAGSDGNMWFTEAYAGRIGEISIGATAASIAPPVVSGGGQAGVQQTCLGARWSSFAFQQAVSDLFAYDGYRWMLNGSAIAGQTSDSYTPTVGEDGDALTCEETVTYPITNVTAVAMSTPVTVTP
jgi:streptogramin lyase